MSLPRSARTGNKRPMNIQHGYQPTFRNQPPTVALCADSLPDSSRPQALGLLQALPAAGNFIAGGLAVALGYRASMDPQNGEAWRPLPEG